MRDAERATRIVVLAPMRIEMRPFASALALKSSVAGDHGVRAGSIGEVEVTAALAGVGTVSAADMAERLIAAVDPDHVIVIGIAGGVDQSMRIGDLVVPEVVIDLRTGAEHRPTPLEVTLDLADAGTRPPARGALLTSDELLDWSELAEHAARGVLAVDMETAAVAAVCERHGVPWSVYRSISDITSDGTVGDEAMSLVHLDGSADLGAVARLVLTRPWKILRLAMLGFDASKAANVAAAAAVSACRSAA